MKEGTVRGHGMKEGKGETVQIVTRHLFFPKSSFLEMKANDKKIGSSLSRLSLPLAQRVSDPIKNAQWKQHNIVYP